MKVKFLKTIFFFGGILLFQTITAQQTNWQTTETTISTTKNVGIGTNNPKRILHIKGDGGISDDVILESEGDKNSAIIAFYKSRANKQPPLLGDNLGNISFRGFTGTEMRHTSSISAFAAGNFGTNAHSDLRFSTAFDGESAERMRINHAGNIGLGTRTSQGILDIVSNGSANVSISSSKNGMATIRFFTARPDLTESAWSGTVGTGNKAWLFQAVSEKSTRWDKGHFGIHFFNDEKWVRYFSIDDKSGTVYIGNISKRPAGYKLAVGGKIIAEELKVKLYDKWADYVFQEGYQLLTLQEVEEHIQEKGHLPNIPSAEELEKADGFEVSKMTNLQQEKIEELFLHLIEMNKKLEELEDSNQSLIKQNQELLQTINLITKQQ